MIENYNGDLPKHVVAQIQEHSAGGFLLFRIGGDGEVLMNFLFDNESSYNSLVRKATITVTALNSIDNSQAIRNFSNEIQFDPSSFEMSDEQDDDDDDEGIKK